MDSRTTSHCRGLLLLLLLLCAVIENRRETGNKGRKQRETGREQENGRVDAVSKGSQYNQCLLLQWCIGCTLCVTESVCVCVWGMQRYMVEGED